MHDIISYLAANGITAERKSVYDDIHSLEEFGLDICAIKSRTTRYYIGSRDFQVSELKLLVDAIQSSKFITEKKSLELIGKLEALASEHEAKQLHSQVIVSRRVKTHNETIYYNVDRLHDAINNNLSVTFYYNHWVLDLGSTQKIKSVRRRDGALYRVSPWELCWDDENYYLIGYDEDMSQLRHYRVDKMEKIELTNRKRSGEKEAAEIDPASYSKATFSMFAGEQTDVALRVHRDFAGVIADRFGTDVFITRDEKSAEYFVVKTKVNISDQFFGWVFALGDRVKIIAPESTAKRFAGYARGILKLYEEDGE